MGPRSIRRCAALPFRRKLSAVRTIGRAVAQGDRRGPHEARLPRRARRRLGGGFVGRGGAWRSRSSPTACSRWACARATRSGSSPRRASSGRSSTTRWRGSARSARRSTRTARRKTARYVLEHSDAVGVLVEDEAQRAKIADVPARPRAHLRRPRRAARPRPRARRARNPEALAEAEAQSRRGGPLHLHLHVGHDRAAEGLHDPPPQLLRDGRGASTACRSSRSTTT